MMTRDRRERVLATLSHLVSGSSEDGSKYRQLAIATDECSHRRRIATVL